MLEYGNDKGMGVDCEAMEAEEEAKGRGVLVKGTLTWRRGRHVVERGRIRGQRESTLQQCRRHFYTHTIVTCVTIQFPHFVSPLGLASHPATISAFSALAVDPGPPHISDYPIT